MAGIWNSKTSWTLVSCLQRGIDHKICFLNHHKLWNVLAFQFCKAPYIYTSIKTTCKGLLRTLNFVHWTVKVWHNEGTKRRFLIYHRWKTTFSGSFQHKKSSSSNHQVHWCCISALFISFPNATIPFQINMQISQVLKSLVIFPGWSLFSMIVGFLTLLLKIGSGPDTV